MPDGVGILVNGQPVAVVNLPISPLDRGLHYGDGLFETLAVRSGRPCLWERHMARLARGCAALRISMPASAMLREEAAQLCAGVDRAVLKIVITRGAGGRGYRPQDRPEDGPATRVMALYPWPEYPNRFWKEGVRVRICRMRLGRNPQLAGLKHLNRLEQVLARAEWQDPEIAEGLMLDQEGYLVEGTQTNVFMVREGALLTPELSQCGVAGIMRGLVMERTRNLVLDCQERRLTLEDVWQVHELFVCNSIIGLWPVADVEGRRFAPGPITLRIAESLCELSLT